MFTTADVFGVAILGAGLGAALEAALPGGVCAAFAFAAFLAERPRTSVYRGWADPAVDEGGTAAGGAVACLAAPLAALFAAFMAALIRTPVAGSRARDGPADDSFWAGAARTGPDIGPWPLLGLGRADRTRAVSASAALRMSAARGEERG